LCAVLAACAANDDLPPPRIEAVTPDRGSVGSVVTVSGSFFCQQHETEDPLLCEHVGQVTFGGVSSIASVYTDTSINCEVPSGLATVRVIVSSGGRVSNGVDFTIDGSFR
jgi:hypothetical protein